MITLPIIIAILIAILAILLILEPQTLEKNAIENRLMRNQFRSTKHKWQTSQLQSFYFCYLCHKLISGWFSSQVLQCKKCGIIVHKICKYLKLRKPDCKYIIAVKQNSKFYHQWRQCSYNPSSLCSICDSLCVGFQSYICIWCNRVRHGDCDGNVQCDFGPLRNLILQPTQIKCKNVGSFAYNAFNSLRKVQQRIKQKVSDDSQQDKANNDILFSLHDKSKTPIVVIINKKSGGQTGNQYIKAFYQALNPLQVISILDQGLQKLKLFTKIPNLFFLIGGGDGTICSELNSIKVVPGWEKHNPPAGILPLGTGNDLSRSLGWGPGSDQVNPRQLLARMVKQGRNELLDRWTMKIIQSEQQKQLTIYNYIGIGLDGKICKQFHDIRQKYPQLFFSQFSNKLIYTQMGAMDLLKGDKLHLSQMMTLKIDGKQISIQGTQNIILMNIMHWGGGVTNLWQANSDFKKQSYSDGLIEIIGLSDLLHMGQVQINMDSPQQIGQGQFIQIQSRQKNKVIPLQIDGEPLQITTPVKIQIRRKDQVNILATNSTQQGKIIRVLQQALNQKIIDQAQYQTILNISYKKHD